ncbi:MAG: 30S ribosomal protein S6 [bacterium]|nr:30S ribosomal protein S6 [bacterium]
MTEALKTPRENSRQAGKTDEIQEQSEHTLYELAYILDGNLSEEKALERAVSLRDIAEKRNSIIVEETQPKLRTLAYEIEKRTAGFFGWIKFLTQSSDIGEIEKQAKRIPEMLRLLTVQSFREELMDQRAKTRRRVVTEEEKGRIKEIDKKLEEILGE